VTNIRAIAKEGYEGQVAAFAVYAPATEDVYVVPISDAPDTSMGLRIEDPDTPSPTVNWADEFGIGAWISSRT